MVLRGVCLLLLPFLIVIFHRTVTARGGRGRRPPVETSPHPVEEPFLPAGRQALPLARVPIRQHVQFLLHLLGATAALEQVGVDAVVGIVVVPQRGRGEGEVPAGRSDAAGAVATLDAREIEGTGPALPGAVHLLVEGGLLLGEEETEEGRDGFVRGWIKEGGGELPDGQVRVLGDVGHLLVVPDGVARGVRGNGSAAVTI
mmetsp:Transcript_34840/g.103892  ORF Transcript_34840/g.103892 Transcript_34840/m.103892 type:complete len:201 (-) Transcript_34840:1739-2341(-)